MSQITQAVEQRAAQVTPAQAIKQSLDRYRPVFAKLLEPTGISEATFAAQIANACRAIPALWTCTPESVLGSALRCAQLGLAPNDPRNLAWIIPYKGEATFQIGYGGVMELARRAVPGLRFDGRPVYPNDEFDLDFGRTPPLIHRPAIVRQLPRGGDAFAWYVRATWPDGAEQVHVLDREGVEYHRKFSKQRDGKMWSESYDAAALKSTVADMKRWLPSSAQLVAALASDEQVLDVREATDVEDVGPIEHTPEVET
jgi:recombination protein RecT